jgi:cbb3-type cytochrome oxidase subunit 3
VAQERKGWGTAPFTVVLAAIVGLCKALFEILMGVIGFFADEMSDQFGGGILVFGLVFLAATLLLLRGSALGYWLTVALSALGAAVALVYAFSGPNEFLVPGLVSAATNLAVIWLLFRPAARAYIS